MNLGSGSRGSRADLGVRPTARAAIAPGGPNMLISMHNQEINLYLNIGDYGHVHQGSPLSTGKA